MKYRTHWLAEFPTILRTIVYSGIVAAVILASAFLISRLNGVPTVSCSNGLSIELVEDNLGTRWTKRLVRVSGENRTDVLWAHDEYLSDFEDIQSLWGCSANWVVFKGTLKGSNVPTLFGLSIQNQDQYVVFAGQLFMR